MDIKKVFGKQENVEKLINYVESFDNKFINFKINDENTFSFFFIPDAKIYSATEINAMMAQVNEGKVLAYGSRVREATVKVNLNSNGASVNYSYPNHFGTKGMDDMADGFDNFLYKEIDKSYKDEVINKFIANKFKDEEELSR